MGQRESSNSGHQSRPSMADDELSEERVLQTKASAARVGVVDRAIEAADENGRKDAEGRAARGVRI